MGRRSHGKDGEPLGKGVVLFGSLFQPSLMMDKIRRLCGYQMPPLGLNAYNLFKHFGPKSLRSELFPGLHANLDFNDETQLATWWQGTRYEKPTPQVLKYWLKDSTVFFDIGANYGYFSYFVSSNFPQVKVHAFEPHPRTFQILNTVKTENNLKGMSCWNFGLADRNEDLELQSGITDLGHTTFGHHPELTTSKDVLKACVKPFSEWRLEQGIPLPDHPQWVVKIDVEGFEAKALRGMQTELDAKCFKGLVVEINEFTLKFCGSSKEEVFGLLERAGYQSIQPTRLEPSFIGECGNTFFVPKS